MRPDDVPEVLEVVKAHWPNFALSTTDAGVRAQAQVWWTMLHDVDLAGVLRALATLDATGREFAPTAGQVRAAAMPAVPDVDEALEEIFDVIRSVGWVGTPHFSHPAMAAAVAACGGWRAVCASENLVALRANLRDMYQSAIQRTVRESFTELDPAATLGIGPVRDDRALPVTSHVVSRHTDDGGE